MRKSKISLEMETTKSWIYDVKCRKCGKIERMHHSTQDQVSAKNFRAWASEHSTFPIEKQCGCDNRMMMLHDIVSFGNVLDLVIV